LAVNVGAVWLGLRAAIRPLRQRGGGSVVITSSIQGSSALPCTSAYTTSKHAVIGMMKGAALELAKDNIRVNCVIPGMTDTPMMDRIHEASGAPERMAAAVRATIPMRRYARPEEIAYLMLFLACQESSYCTGSTYVADGGILASWTSTPD
jgi:NAD(P)-dependent dehydrogenase (short-subunit alcohol dehydrogenase family)